MILYKNRLRTQRGQPREVPGDPTRCAARLKGYWRGEQCSRARLEGDRYCHQHRKLLDEMFPGAEQ
jgi:hypothetical protein